MTHAEITAGDRTGFRSTCPGDLTELGRFNDLEYSGGGPPRARSCRVYRCACGADLSVVHDTGEVLNVYRRPAPALAPGTAREEAGPT